MVSEIKTPIEFIEKKLDIDYVKADYMRLIATKYYPGWSWTQDGQPKIKFISEGTELYPPQSFIMVKGTLSWEEFGVARVGGMSAAHQMKFTRRPSKGKGPLEAWILVDPGNDIKSANTDCLKKALNLYLNICDDVYRFLGPELTEVQEGNLKRAIEKILSDQDLLKKSEESKMVKRIITQFDKHGYFTNKANYETHMGLLKSIIQK